MPANTAVVCSGLKNSCGGILVVQPYLFAKGHFRKYFENLLSENYNYIYCNDRDNHYLKSLWVKSLNIDNEKNFLNFVFSRLFNSLKINYFIWKKSDTTLLKIHFIEFEPFSFMAYELLTFYRKKKILITIHSIKRMRYKNRFKDLISAFQRMIYYRAVSHANKKGYRFIVHYETHKEQLLKIIKTANIEVIDYPCPYPLSEKPLTKGKGNLLIFGQIREDKGIYDFLKDKKSARLSITIAGRIEDTRILSLNRQNMNIVNKYLTEAELSNIINDHDFVIFPYDRHYTGGAGTLKDSFSYGKPVICSDIPVFKEIVNAYHTGFIYRDVEDIASFVRSIDDQQYNEMSNNCLTYAKNHNWNTMRESYFRLYDSI